MSSTTALPSVPEVTLAPREPERSLLLWVEGGVMFSINSIATFIWKLLEDNPKGLSLTVIAKHVEQACNSAGECDVSLEEITRDCEELLSRFCQKGVIKEQRARSEDVTYRAVEGVLRIEDGPPVISLPGSRQSLPSALPVPEKTVEAIRRILTPASQDPTLRLTVVQQIAQINEHSAGRYTCVALIALVIQDILLKLLGFNRVCRIVRWWPVAKWRRPQVHNLLKLCAGIERARIWYPKGVACLNHSSVVTCLLRSHGIPARMAVGGRPRPFRSHAWSEIGGRVVNDTQKVQTFYRVFERY